MIEPSIIIVSGIPGAGKSTVAGLLARGFPRGVHLEADLLHKLIVSGGQWPEPDGSSESEGWKQLRLRQRNVGLLADSFFQARFTVVVDEIVIGKDFDDIVNNIKSRPVFLVMLHPNLASLQRRNKQRQDKDVFDTWKYLYDVVEFETPKVGLWLETSHQTAEETVNTILERVWTEGKIR